MAYFTTLVHSRMLRYMAIFADNVEIAMYNKSISFRRVWWKRTYQMHVNDEIFKGLRQ